MNSHMHTSVRNPLRAPNMCKHSMSFVRRCDTIADVCPFFSFHSSHRMAVLTPGEFDTQPYSGSVHVEHTGQGSQGFIIRQHLWSNHTELRILSASRSPSLERILSGYPNMSGRHRLHTCARSKRGSVFVCWVNKCEMFQACKHL